MDAGSLSYIREYYGVPARVGARILYGDRLGGVVGAQNAHVLIQLDGETTARPYHPIGDLIYV
jgi:hypothetical protein